MKKSISAVLLLGIALACVAFLRGERKGDNSQSRNFGFGLQIAGAYYGEFVAYLPEPTPPILVLNTFDAEGTGMAVSPELYGNGDPAFLGLRSPLHYSWKRTGPRKLAFTGIYLAFDENGALGAPALGGGSVLRMTGETEFTRDLQVSSGAITADVFMADQDPLDPAEEPLFSFPMTYEFRRINVQTSPSGK